jgi:hypothetical protein
VCRPAILFSFGKPVVLKSQVQIDIFNRSTPELSIQLTLDGTSVAPASAVSKIYPHTYIHTQIYIYIYISIYVC